MIAPEKAEFMLAISSRALFAVNRLRSRAALRSSSVQVGMRKPLRTRKMALKDPTALVHGDPPYGQVFACTSCRMAGQRHCGRKRSFARWNLRSRF
jgi:hypothetical protein